MLQLIKKMNKRIHKQSQPHYLNNSKTLNKFLVKTKHQAKNALFYILLKYSNMKTKTITFMIINNQNLEKNKINLSKQKEALTFIRKAI